MPNLKVYLRTLLLPYHRNWRRASVMWPGPRFSGGALDPLGVAGASRSPKPFTPLSSTPYRFGGRTIEASAPLGVFSTREAAERAAQELGGQIGQSPADREDLFRALLGFFGIEDRGVIRRLVDEARQTGSEEMGRFDPAYPPTRQEWQALLTRVESLERAFAALPQSQEEVSAVPLDDDDGEDWLEGIPEDALMTQEELEAKIG
jgi:hypothetical protein